MPIVRVPAAGFAALTKSWPGEVVATHLAGDLDYRQVDYDAGPVMLVMGSEKLGLPDSYLAHCSKVCKIPMDGQADSLNLAIATGLLAFEIRRNTLKLLPS
jgi:TrmH family RNA methyltransferase